MEYGRIAFNEEGVLIMTRPENARYTGTKHVRPSYKRNAGRSAIVLINTELGVITNVVVRDLASFLDVMGEIVSDFDRGDSLAVMTGATFNKLPQNQREALVDLYGFQANAADGYFRAPKDNIEQQHKVVRIVCLRKNGVGKGHVEVDFKLATHYAKLNLYNMRLSIEDIDSLSELEYDQNYPYRRR